MRRRVGGKVGLQWNAKLGDELMCGLKNLRSTFSLAASTYFECWQKKVHFVTR